MEGVDCAERAILPKKLLREQLQQFIENDFSMSTQVKTLKDFKQHTGENECVNATIGILEFTNKLKEVPKVYKTLLKEIRKDSPISSWLPSFSQKDTRLLLSFLKQECDTFGDFQKARQLSNAFPYITRLISELFSFHSTTFLPKHLSAFFISLLNLRESFDIKAEQRAVKRTKPKSGYESCRVEIYPNLPEHTIENEYLADIEKDKSEDASCSKAYNSKVDITGGITHLSCEHNVVKGFTALYKGESALQVFFTFESIGLMSFFSNFNVFLFKL